MNFQRLLVFLAASVCVCGGVHVTVREKQRFAMLFQSVVLPCQFQTGSVQTPVVQWWYKSWCRDRSRDSFSLPGALSYRGSGASAQPECSDGGRTVRIVASAQGPSMTLAEHYKGRDIAIVNKADLRIGELQWGDSGVYFCKVVIADDLEGKNEAQLELLVLGRTGEQDDLLPEFDVEIMPEWVFVGCVIGSSLLFLLLLGLCWCQCCPHSCCCYVRCCCCPETCCCPRHLYEAGRTAKGAQPAQLPVYPYYIPGVPAVVPAPPSSRLEPKISSIPSLEKHLAGVRSGYRLKAGPDQDSMKVLYFIEKELVQFPSHHRAALKPGSFSELSSLHDGGTSDFRHAYQTVQMKALPPIADLRPAQPAQSRRPRPHRAHLSDDELDRRWNRGSERVQRKTLRGRTGSLDELEEFARCYGSGGRQTRSPDEDYSPARRRYGDEEDRAGSPSPPPQKRRDTWDGERPSGPRSRGYDHAFLSGVLQNKARTRGGAGRPDEDSDTPSKSSSRGKESSCSRSASSRPEDDDPLPPYSEREAERHRRSDLTVDRYHAADDRYHAADDRYRTADDRYRTADDRYHTADDRYRTADDRYRTADDRYHAADDRYRTADDRYHAADDRYRTADPPRPAASRPFSYTRNHQGASQTLQGPRQDRDRDRNRNLNTALSRDTLIV